MPGRTVKRTAPPARLRPEDGDTTPASLRVSLRGRFIGSQPVVSLGSNARCHAEIPSRRPMACTLQAASSFDGAALAHKAGELELKQSQEVCPACFAIPHPSNIRILRVEICDSL